MTNKRPTGVTIVAILNILAAIILLGAAGLFTFIIPLIGESTDSLFWWAIAIIYALGIGQLLLSIGMLKGWKPVWYIAILLWIVEIVASIYNFNVAIIVIDAVCLWYFFRKNVKEYFGVD